MAPRNQAGPRGTSRPALRSLGWAAGVLLVARVGAGVWDERHPPAPEASQVRWSTAAGADAALGKPGKPVLIEFSAEWCGPCKVMGREVFNNAEDAAFINERFVPVRAVDGEAGAKALQKRYGIEAYPTLVVVAKGKELSRQRGYGGAATTMAFLRRYAGSAGR